MTIKQRFHTPDSTRCGETCPMSVSFLILIQRCKHNLINLKTWTKVVFVMDEIRMNLKLNWLTELLPNI